MRNFENEIRELTKDIKDLRVTKEDKGSQLDGVSKEQRESIKNKKTTTFTEEILRDHFDKPISIGDWVKVTTKGRFNSKHGRVKDLKSE